MKPARFAMPPVPGELPQPGDLWRVAEVSLTGHVIFERVEASPDQYRSPRDGLHPRVPAPDTRPISAAEAQALNDEMDAALDRKRDAMRAWAFSPDNPLNARDCPAHDSRCRPGDCVLGRLTVGGGPVASRPRGFGG